jgi:hypothetical protein
LRFGPDVEWIEHETYDVDPARAESFYARIRTYWPGLPDGTLVPDYSGIRPKLTGPGEPAADFMIAGPAQHGLPGLVNLFGIESPGLTSALSLAQAVVAALEREDAPGKTLELGGPQVYTFAELMRYMLRVLSRRRLLLDVPFGIATLQARFLELLPEPLLTRDQVELLKHDNVVSPGMPGFEALGITPTPIELIVPQYLARHRAEPVRAGRFPR